MNRSDRVREIVEEYRARLAETLGGELEAVVLYGSQARRDAEAGSDIDVLCVMRGPFDHGALIRRTAEAAAEVSLRHDVVISTAFVTSEDYRRRNTPFLMNVRREGVAL